MSQRFAGCVSSATLTKDETQQLAALPGLELGPMRREWCELEPGHHGPHLSTAAVSVPGDGRADQWWWLSWGYATRALMPAPICSASLADGIDNGSCGVRAGHAGRHTYEWGPVFPEVHLDGYSLAIRALEATTAGPPVVFVNALGSAMTGSWDPVVSRLQPGPRLICYDRAALGASRPRPSDRRTTTYHGYAAELVDLLDRLGVDEPVVLVGHSIGSLIVRVLAAQWPARVAGMVHVDGTVPEVLALDADRDGFDGDAPGATWIDYLAGAAEVKAATTFPRVPCLVLVRTSGYYVDDQVPDLDERWNIGQQQLVELTGACRVDAADAGHYLQADVPDLVALAVRAVVDAARHHSPVQLNPTVVELAGGVLAR